MATKKHSAIEFANVMIDALVAESNLPFDNCDKASVGDEERATFIMSQYHDAKVGPNRCDIKPLGMVVYTVTVEAKYIPYEDE